MTKRWVCAERPGKPTIVGQVDIDEDGRITFAPPIWRKFVGQRWERLRSWLFNDCHYDLTIKEL